MEYKRLYRLRFAILDILRHNEPSTSTFHGKDDQLLSAADRGKKLKPTFAVDIMDEQNQVVAHVEKLLYVRKKKAV